MTDPFLLCRILLNFKSSEAKDIIGNLSAAAFTPEGSLWLGCDEFTHLERLSLKQSNHYQKHERFNLAEFLDLPNAPDEEIDIEGLDFSEPYLWLTGSHSTKRKKPKTDDSTPKRLKEISTEKNRYLIARVPLDYSDPINPVPVAQLSNLKAASLPIGEQGQENALIKSFLQDDYLRDFAKSRMPSKENGIDIEGLAVSGNRIFLGLRGPVLRGWALILELEIEDSHSHELVLKPIGSDGLLYKKHFLDLNGLGIRELCLQGEDLIVLAGPTMAVFGAMQIYRLKQVFDLSSDSLLRRSDRLELLFNLPFNPAADNAEGIALFSWFKDEDSILVVYDSPGDRRLVDADKVYADVFRL